MINEQFEKDKQEFQKLLQDPMFVSEHTGMVVAVSYGNVVCSGYIDDEVISLARAETGSDNIYFGVVPEAERQELLDTTVIV